MANGTQLPPGFVLDAPAQPSQGVQLPPGFVPDQPPADLEAEAQRRAAQGPSPAVVGVAGREQPEQSFLAALLLGEGRITPGIADLPELAAAPVSMFERGDPTGLRIGAALTMTTDVEAQKDIIRDVAPEVQFSEDAKGNVIADFGEDRRFLLNRPGLSFQDAASAVANILSFLGPAKAAGVVQGLVKRAGVGAAGAAAVDVAQQQALQAAGSQQPFDPTRTAVTAGLGAGAEVAAGLIPATRARLQAARTGVTAEEAAAARPLVGEAREAAEATGIPLFQAQQTALPSQLERQAFVAQLPAGSRKASEALRRQNQAASDAVDNLLDTIAPPEAVVSGPARFRTAAQRAIDARKAARSEKTSPLFEAAFDAAPDVDVRPIVSQIDEAISSFPKGGEVERTMRKAKQLIVGRGEKPTLRQLQNAKLEMDQMLSRFGENSLGNTTKRELQGVKNALLEQMDTASPQFAEARRAFAEASPEVNALKDSIVGKISQVDETQLKNISRRIFDPAETNPEVVRAARKTIQDVDPGAWNELVRSELERRIGSIRVSEGLTTENVPGQLSSAIFGNAKQRAVLFNSVDAETKKNLRFLETALSRARLGRPGGSQTAAREEIKRELRGGVGETLRKAFRKPVSTLVETGQDASFNRRVSALTDALFDTEFRPQMKKLRTFNPDSPAAARAMAQLLDEAEKARREATSD